MKYLSADLLSFYSLFAILGLVNHGLFGGRIWYWILVITIGCLILAIPYYLFRRWNSETHRRKISLTVWWLLDVACLVANFTIGLDHSILPTQ